MNGLLSFEHFSQNSVEKVSQEILELNEISSEYGLTLSPEDALDLAETRNRSLEDNDRLEIGVGAIAEIIKHFSKSRYVMDNEDYAAVLNAVTDIFYYIKTETEDKISDKELLDELFRRFELNCRGSVDLLLEREAERIIRKFTSGENYSRWYAERDNLDESSRETPVNLLRDDYETDVWAEEREDYLSDEDNAYDGVDELETELDLFDDYLDELAEQDKVEDPTEPDAGEEKDDRDEWEKSKDRGGNDE